MKNVKTMYRKLTMMVVLGVLLAVMSCNNLLTPPKGNSTDRDSGSGNVSEGGKVLITLKLFTGSARMVMPDIEQLDWNITAEQGTDSIPATGTYPTYTLELPTTGSWTFTVKGTKENKELFTGTVTENVSNSTVSISIPLSPGSGMGEGSGATGKLNLTIKPENVLTMTLSYRVDGGNWYNCTTSSGLNPDQGSYWIPYSISGTYPVGQHTLDLYFGGGSKFYFCTVAVNIWPGMTSDQWIKTNGEEYINDSGEFVITEEMVNEFVKTMGSVVFVDASVDANTPATGSIFAPVNSVSTAVDILQKANPDGNYSGTIMVSGKTTIDREIVVKNGETLTVKGTGTGDSITNDKGRVFNIASGGSLTLGENITLTGTNDTGNGGAVYVNGGTFTMKADSKITGSSATGTTASGGAIYVASGTFTMSDTATIQDNRATTHGGGVHIFSGGTFTMNGGTIGGTAANTAEYGGGVFVSGGTFNMNDGTISGNTVTKSGGGVYVNDGNFTMKGGTIGGTTANTASQNGGGVHVFNGIFTMTGGTLSGNTATQKGGGVYVSSTGNFTLGSSSAVSSPVISGNTKTGNSTNNVYLDGTILLIDGKLEKTVGPGNIGVSMATTGINVTLSSFWISPYEVTQAEFKSIMTGNPNGIASNPSHFQGEEADGEVQERRPVENVRWYDAIVYCNLLSMKEGLTPCYTIKGSTNPADWGVRPDSQIDNNYNYWNSVTCDFEADGYRLPTAAEWEYAARGGKTGITDGTWDNIYSGSDTPESVAWYDSNSDSKTHEVGKKQANALGLYDMSGNLKEWCWNRKSEDVDSRVMRGGYYSSVEGDCQVTASDSNLPISQGPDQGFRVVRSIR